MKGSRFFVFVLLVLLILYTLFQLNGYLAYRELLPPGTTISGLDVGGLTEEMARNVVEQAFDSSVILSYDDETIKLHPNRIEFRLNQSIVWAELARRRNQTSFLPGSAPICSVRTSPLCG